MSILLMMILILMLMLMLMAMLMVMMLNHLYQLSSASCCTVAVLSSLLCFVSFFVLFYFVLSSLYFTLLYFSLACFLYFSFVCYQNIFVCFVSYQKKGLYFSFVSYQNVESVCIVSYQNVVVCFVSYQNVVLAYLYLYGTYGTFCLCIFSKEKMRAHLKAPYVKACVLIYVSRQPILYLRSTLRIPFRLT